MPMSIIYYVSMWKRKCAYLKMSTVILIIIVVLAVGDEMIMVTMMMIIMMVVANPMNHSDNDIFSAHFDTNHIPNWLINLRAELWIKRPWAKVWIVLSLPIFLLLFGQLPISFAWQNIYWFRLENIINLISTSISSTYNTNVPFIRFVNPIYLIYMYLK